MSPYTAANFYEAIGIFFLRLPLLLLGDVLYPDEIQFLTLTFLSAGCALIGSILMVRKELMLANALSHTVLIGIVAVFLLGQQTGFDGLNPFSPTQLALAALIGAFLTLFLIKWCREKWGFSPDASIGISFSFLFALGIFLLSILSKNAHVGVELLMGSADALVEEDVVSSIASFFLALVLFWLFLRVWKVISFDPLFASTLGWQTDRWIFFLFSITALILLISFRVVGVVMVLGLISLPPLIVRPFSSSLQQVGLRASILGALVSIAAVALSRHLLSIYALAVATGSLQIVLLLFLLLALLLFKKFSMRLSLK
jgi:manganese/zinc/iron transport system permease protein